MEVTAPLNFRARWIPADVQSDSWSASPGPTQGSLNLQPVTAKERSAACGRRGFGNPRSFLKLSGFPSAKAQTWRANVTCPRSHSKSKSSPRLSFPEWGSFQSLSTALFALNEQTQFCTHTQQLAGKAALEPRKDAHSKQCFCQKALWHCPLMCPRPGTDAHSLP